LLASVGPSAGASLGASFALPSGVPIELSLPVSGVPIEASTEASLGGKGEASHCRQQSMPGQSCALVGASTAQAEVPQVPPAAVQAGPCAGEEDVQATERPRGKRRSQDDRTDEP
jgi:hypothetical protein